MNHSDNGVSKRQISEAVFFAINNIPDVDQPTLEKFLELVNTTGTFGAMNYEQFRAKMKLTLRYIPNASPESLIILADLLDVPLLAPPIDSPPATPQLQNVQNGQTPAAFDETPAKSKSFQKSKLSLMTGLF